MFIFSKQIIPKGKKVLLEFFIPQYKEKIVIDGKITHIQKNDIEHMNIKEGFGIQFLKFHGNSRKTLSEYLRRQESKDDILFYYV